jgi:hypothetical protein
MLVGYAIATELTVRVSVVPAHPAAHRAINKIIWLPVKASTLRALNHAPRPKQARKAHQ